jgi:ubiquitin-conjugating enzyme E2 G1
MQDAKDLPGISCGLVDDNVFEWEVMLMISDDCKYYGGSFPSPHPPALQSSKLTLPSRAGGNFRCILSFPANYPLLPPSLTFKAPIPFHPNIYASGLLCISILHPPEDDQYGYETAAERWSPVQTPETILLSVISLLHGPNDESPANVEAARLWREEKDGSKEFKRICRKVVRESLGEE